MTTLSTRPILVIVLLLAAAPVRAQTFPAFDPERVFMLGDADLDGRLSLDEYKEFQRSSPRMRNAADGIEPLFRRLDTNQDGLLSLGEYRRSFPLRREGVTGRSDPLKPTAYAEPADAGLPSEQTLFFESKIQPILQKHCYKCHSGESEKPGAGFRLDSRNGLRLGGNSGPAVVPHNPEKSLLIQAIRYQDDHLQMPPDEKLSDSVISDFEDWVKSGAPDPRTGGDSADNLTTSKMNLAKVRDFWAFKPLVKNDPPQVNASGWPRCDIDRFLIAALESRGISPVADASRQRLLRRVTFDLIGLPPTPDEFDAFLSDDSPQALQSVVDRLLASPRYGERWGRHWLDVARYAESSGKTNFSYPHAWRYRDWTINSFNTDKPYDQFVREQIAGDLLPAAEDRQRADQVIATGFLALGSKAHDAENRGQFVLDLVDEQIEATTRAFLGLTVACARCHDHKMDPISQRDYYALSGIFRSTQTCSGTLAGVFPNFNASPLVELPPGANTPSAVPALTSERRTMLQGSLAALVKDREAIPPDEANRDRMRRANSMIATLRLRLLIDRPDNSPRTFAMGVQERDEAIDSPLYVRGELDHAGTVVPRGLGNLLGEHRLEAIMEGSGRRELAEWLASPSNPLTARVFVNRVWQHLFGRGMVSTPDNFGAAGATPSHPEFLDHLAVNFMNNGWSVKRLIRQIVLSRAYGLDSTHDAQNFEADPDNTFVWRMTKRRLDAEVLRDALLSVGGQLDENPPVGSVVARVGEGLALLVRVEGLDASDHHRSIYLPVIRDQVLEGLALFDFADPSLVTGERNTTSGPAQALYFMNAPLVIRQSNSFAERILSVPGNDSQRVALAYRLALARDPTVTEQERAVTFLTEFASRIKGAEPTREAWSALCQALLASAEFRYLD